MVAINQNNKSQSGKLETEDIYFNTNLKRWFARNKGLWKSNRTYFIQEDNKIYNLCMFLKIEELDKKNAWESHYRFSWYPEKEYNFFKEYPQYKEKGVMNASLEGHQLIREKFYLKDSQGISNIKQVDEHEMIFESTYDKWHILEHTRLVDMDNYRFRVIYSWNENNIKIIENHHETKLNS